MSFHKDAALRRPDLNQDTKVTRIAADTHAASTRARHSTSGPRVLPASSASAMRFSVRHMTSSIRSWRAGVVSTSLCISARESRFRPVTFRTSRTAREMREVLKVTGRNLDSLAEMHKFVETTPALQLRMLEVMWRTEKRIAEALLAGKTRGPEVECRARVLAACVSAAMRVTFVSWFKSGRRSVASLWKDIEKALAMLRSGFDSRGSSRS